MCTTETQLLCVLNRLIHASLCYICDLCLYSLVPERVQSFRLLDVTSSSASMTWSPPLNFHGTSLGYTLVLSENLLGSSITRLSNDITSYSNSSLVSYISYSATVFSSTVIGSGVNRSINFVTCQDGRSGYFLCVCNVPT